MKIELGLFTFSLMFLVPFFARSPRLASDLKFGVSETPEFYNRSFHSSLKFEHAQTSTANDLSSQRILTNASEY